MNDIQEYSKNTQSAANSRAKAGKHLTFRLADAEYGIESLKVQETQRILDLKWQFTQLQTDMRLLTNNAISDSSLNLG